VKEARPRADAAGEGSEPGPDPGGVGPFSREHRPVGGKFGAAVGDVDHRAGGPLEGPFLAEFLDVDRTAEPWRKVTA
jgi:hypothetical protein